MEIWKSPWEWTLNHAPLSYQSSAVVESYSRIIWWCSFKLSLAIGCTFLRRNVGSIGARYYLLKEFKSIVSFIKMTLSFSCLGLVLFCLNHLFSKFNQISAIPVKYDRDFDIMQYTHCSIASSLYFTIQLKSLCIYRECIKNNNLVDLKQNNLFSLNYRNSWINKVCFTWIPLLFINGVSF